MKTCNICGKDFHSLGYASHRAKHTRDEEKQRNVKLTELINNGWSVKRNNFTPDRFNIIDASGNVLPGVFAYNEAVRIAWEQSTKGKTC